MTEPCGIDVLVGLYIGARVDFHKEKEPLIPTGLWLTRSLALLVIRRGFGCFALSLAQHNLLVLLSFRAVCVPTSVV